MPRRTGRFRQWSLAAGLLALGLSGLWLALREAGVLSRAGPDESPPAESNGGPGGPAPVLSGSAPEEAGPAPPAPAPPAPGVGGAEPEMGRVEIVVVDPEGGPVAEAWVRVVPPEAIREAVLGGPIDTVTARTGAGGRAQIEVPGRWMVGLAHVTAGHAERGLIGASAHRLQAARPAVVVVAPGGATLRGRVVDLPENLSERTFISAYSNDWPEAPRQLYIPVDAAGEFSALVLPGWISLFVLSAGRGVGEAWQGTLEAGEAVDLRLRVGPPAVEGKVRVVVGGPAPRPMPPGAQVLVGARPGGHKLTAVVQEDGAVVLPGLVPGEAAYLMAWSHRDPDSRVWISATAPLFRVEPGDWSRGATVVVPAAAHLEFQVTTDLPDRALAGVPLELYRLGPGDTRTLVVSGRSGADGAWRPFDRRAAGAAGDYSLLIPGRGEVWTGRGVEGRQDVRLHVPGGRSVAVRLLDADGAPVPCREVFVRVVRAREPVYPDHSKLVYVGEWARFDQESQVACYYPQDMEGEAELEVIERGVSVRRIPLHRGDPQARMDVRMTGGRAHLRFVDSDGRPIRPRSAVSLVRLTGPEIRYGSSTDDAGQATFCCLPPGEYDITVSYGDAYVSVGPPLRIGQDGRLVEALQVLPPR